MFGFVEPPPPPSPGPDREPPERSHPGPAGAASPAGPEVWNLRLESVGSNLPVGLLDGSPSVAVLAVEDLCWEAAVEDWKRRRPPRWRIRSRAAWEAEGAWLAARSDHLKRLAAEVLREL
jgi:hypothetical protein